MGHNNQWTHVTPEDRFWQYVDKTENCWLWTGHTARNGYAQFRVNGKYVTVHRWAYEKWVGSIPSDLQCDHLCRVRHCVNPKHIELVTRLENVRRGIVGITQRARQKAKTHCPQGHPYIEGNIYWYGNGFRLCRRCSLDRDKARYWRNKQARIIAG